MSRSHPTLDYDARPDWLGVVFPFYFELERDLGIVGLGRTSARLFGLQTGDRFDEFFRLRRPERMLSFEAIAETTQDFFLVEHRKSGLQLRGQFLAFPGRNRLIFLCSPWLTDSHQLLEHNLQLSDFALHDTTFDMLHALQASKAAAMDAQRAIDKLRAKSEQLRRSNIELRQLSSVIESMTDGVLLFESDLRPFSYVNPGAARIVGVERWQLMQMLPDALFEDSPGASLGDLIGDLASSKSEAMNFSARIARSNGGSMPVSVLLQKLPSDSGGSQFLLAVRDMALEYRERRTQRLESIGTLAGGLAHDLNNMLSPMMMAVQLLRGDHLEALPPDVRRDSAELLDTIERITGRAADMVRNLLSYARGGDSIRGVVRVAEVFAEIEGLLGVTFPKNIRIQTSIAADLPDFVGDATQIYQAVFNLLINARDAMPEGGIVYVDAVLREVDEAFVNSVADRIWGPIAEGPYVVLSVKDQGGGMDDVVADRIFDPFFSTKGKGQGTGLGLTSVLGIVKGHGGFIKVHSDLGIGSRFELYMPFVSESSSSLTAPALPQPSTGFAEGTDGGRGLQTILYVDDEEGLRRVAGLILRQRGYRGLVCEDAAEGLLQVAMEGDGLAGIITDISMPGIDGIEFVRAVRRLRVDIPIAVASGRYDDDQVAALAELGVTVLLKKPFGEADFIKALSTILAHESTGV